MGTVLIKWDQLGHHIKDIASFIKEKIRKLQNSEFFMFSGYNHLDCITLIFPIEYLLVTSAHS